MKPDGHLEDLNSTNVLQMARSASRKRLNVFHNVNMQIEFVFVGDRDIHVDMVLCATSGWHDLTN